MRLHVGSEKKVKLAEVAEDVSAEILEAWSARLEVMPSLEDLPRILDAPLARAIPVDASMNPSSVLSRPVNDVVGVGRGRVKDFALLRLWASVMELPRVGSSKDCLHGLYDSLILHVLHLLSRYASFVLFLDRNTVDKSGPSDGNARPDFLCWLPSGILAFKGEEKASEMDLPVACDELSEKLTAWGPMFFGELPYQLGYAAAGEAIQFFALDVRNNGKRVPLCDPFSISDPRGRSLLVRRVVNVFRVLRTLHNRSQGQCLRLGGVSKRDGSCLITIIGDHVRK